jgi:S1-C subfamily serine protease
VPPPDRSVSGSSAASAAAAGVVRVRGLACGLGVEGSGWIAAPGVVVTNAHVVAGVDRPLVDRHGGRARRGRVVYFDAKDDLALIRVPGLVGKPLALAEPMQGLSGALLGYPQNGPLRATPVRLGATLQIVGRDAYGRFPTTRKVTTLRGAIRSGNSGGPVVDADGAVVATAFARRVGSDGGYGVPSAAVARALSRMGGAVASECVER